MFFPSMFVHKYSSFVYWMWDVRLCLSIPCRARGQLCTVCILLVIHQFSCAATCMCMIWLIWRVLHSPNQVSYAAACCQQLWTSCNHVHTHLWQAKQLKMSRHRCSREKRLRLRCKPWVDPHMACCATLASRRTRTKNPNNDNGNLNRNLKRWAARLYDQCFGWAKQTQKYFYISQTLRK